MFERAKECAEGEVDEPGRKAADGEGEEANISAHQREHHVGG